jgi:hypothetical protein
VQSSDELVHRVKPLVPSDEPTVHYLVASDELQRKSNRDSDVGGASDEPTPWKSLASVHPTLPFSVAVIQRLFGCLGLFISPPLTHLRVLDCVEVQRSSRHIEDHIQSIQVLNCSSLDLYMLCVCA